MTTATTTPTGEKTAAERKPEWAPRMWEGCDFFTWLKLLAKNRFAVHPSFWYIVVIATIVSFNHTLLRLLQEAIFGRRVRKTKITQPPIFLLGHWRTGTTLLHELMIQDERFGYPTTYECLDPNHFLLTEKLFTKWLKFLVPKHRPMDNMKAGFDRPQEDEFALCMTGQSSPYNTIAFPNRPAQGQEYLEPAGLTGGTLRSWKRALKQFLKQVTYKNPKRLVLKSPPHTARIAVLKEMFPDAIFVHIVRDPYVVYPSTINLWKTLYRTHGLQKPNFLGLEELVLSTYVKMYAKLEEGKKLLDPGQFFELKYEDLVRDPVSELGKLYEHLQLGGFDEYRPRLEAYLATLKGYETNKYQVTPQERETISRRWAEVIRRYGYEGS